MTNKLLEAVTLLGETFEFRVGIVALAKDVLAHIDSDAGDKPVAAVLDC